MAASSIPLDLRFPFPKARPVERISTGIAAVDALCSGGIPRGSLTEIYGPASSGRTSLLLSLLASVTARQEFAAVIDASDAFDPASAVDAGVHLPRIVWIRCGGNAEHALKATDLIVQGGGFGVVVMDLGDIAPRTANRISLASWFRLRHSVERTPAALVVVGRMLNAKSCSMLQLETTRNEIVWRGKLLKGIRVTVRSSKHHQVTSAEFDCGTGDRFPVARAN